MLGSEPIPPEFRGLTRQFKQAVWDSATAIAKTISVVTLRLDREKLTRVGIKSATARLSEVTAFRLGAPIFANTRTTQLQWRATYLGDDIGLASYRGREFTDSGLLGLHVEVRRVFGPTHSTRTDVQCVPMFSICDHAIGRWFQRSGSRDYNLLIADLACIVDAPGDNIGLRYAAVCGLAGLLM